MAVVLKKKTSEPIRKVSVRSACVCSGTSYNCDCSCYKHTLSYGANNLPEAQVCANLYYYNRVNVPIS